MRIILLQDIEKIGKRYEIKEVASGYARNFLIPRGLVRIADQEALEWLKIQQEEIAEKAKQELNKQGKLASSIDGLELEVPVKIGEKGQFFEKITPQKIAHQLKEEGFDVAKEQIEISDEITETGEFPAKIKFGHNLEVEIKLIVAKEAEEKDD